MLPIEKMVVATGCNWCVENFWISYHLWGFFHLLYHSRDTLKCVSVHTEAACQMHIKGAPLIQGDFKNFVFSHIQLRFLSGGGGNGARSVYHFTPRHSNIG